MLWNAAPESSYVRDFAYDGIGCFGYMVGEIYSGKHVTTLRFCSRRVTYFDTTLALDIHEMYGHLRTPGVYQSLRLLEELGKAHPQAWSLPWTVTGRSDVLQEADSDGHDRPESKSPLEIQKASDGPTDVKMPPKKRTTIRTTTTPMTDAAIKALIAKGVVDALAEYEAHRSSGNGNDSHESGSGRRTERVSCECTYSDFLKCQPLNFKGTEGVVGLTQWFEKMESWNSHVKTVGHDAAYGMPWKTLKKMMIDKYCPRGEIKKLEI
ncbi:hypothetical protein Tco_0895442 [Tanacetum coccineum]|uniref:Reverse transcriptase domain-containing protein n=1 Tax=Tanacetum coccineum TaxID=301880 RepID=A0ABQ5CEZ3_9ASTR